MAKLNFYNSTAKVWTSPLKISIHNGKENLGDMLLHGLTIEPNKISEIHENFETVMKCEEIKEKSILASKKFKSMNLQFGQVITFASRQFPEFSSLICGCIINGIVVNIVNPEHNRENFKRIINHTLPKLIFCDKYNKNLFNEVLKELAHDAKLIDVDNKISIHSLFEVLKTDNDYQPCMSSTHTNDLPVLILETAGSTGLPKLVVFNENNVIYQLRNMICIKKDDIISVSPFMHLLSGIGSTLIGIMTGAIRIVSSQINTEVHLNQIQKYKITSILASTAYLAALADSKSFKSIDLSSIKIIQISGEALMKTLKEQVESQLLNGKVVTSYSLVDCFGSVTLNYPIFKEYSVGQPVLQNEIKIIDESGNNLGPRETGEICVKPYNSNRGCYLNVDLNKQFVDKDGFIHTGDIGYFDDDSFLFIVGRLKNIVNYKGHAV